MAQERGRRPAGGNRSGRPQEGSGKGRPRSQGTRPDRPQRGDSQRGGSQRGGSQRGGPQRDSQRGGPQRPRRDERTEERTEDQRRYDGPDIPEEVTGRELDRTVRAQLRSLPEKLELRVARHLAAAGLVIDSDPKLAYEHALAARARAGRLAIVREAVGEAAYAAGEYSEALAELRAAKRMNGSGAYLAIMADCERALGRPDRALTLLRNAKGEYPAEQRAEMVIVEAGARRDRGELDAALRCLENAPLHSRSRAPWVARLRYAYADVLLAAGRDADALEWFHRTEAVDGEQLTDAADRVRELDPEG